MSSFGTFWKLAAGAGVLMVYGIYFLWKRRSDSFSKQRMNIFRLQKKEKPLFHKNPAIEKMVIKELCSGRESLNKGDIDSGVDHLKEALKLTSDPEELMDCFKYIMPPEVYQRLPYQEPVEDKRWSDPEFMAALINKPEKIKSSTCLKKKPGINKERELLHKHKLENLNSGVELLNKGDTAKGMELISNVLANCFQPEKLLQSIQKKLSPEIFRHLHRQITSAKRTFDAKLESTGMGKAKEIQAPKIG